MSQFLMQAVSSTSGAVKTWVTQAPDFAGASFPGPGSPLHICVATDIVAGSGNSKVFPHDTTFSPTVLYQFHDSLADSSGNGHNLSGTAFYTDIFPGMRGVVQTGATLIRNDDAALQAATGDMTWETLIYPSQAPDALGFVVAEQSYGVNDTQQAYNYLWQVAIFPTTLRYFHEYGVGLDQSHSISASVPNFQISHLAFTRISNVVQFYLNGAAVGPASATLIPPDGGSLSKLLIGADDTGNGTNTPATPFVGVLASQKIIVGRGLTAAEIASEYNRTMGARFNLAA